MASGRSGDGAKILVPRNIQRRRELKTLGVYYARLELKFEGPSRTTGRRGCEGSA